MPIYEFKCQDCNLRFEEQLSMKESSHTPACPKCGNSKVTRVFSSFTIGESKSGFNLPSAPSCPTGTCPL